MEHGRLLDWLRETRVLELGAARVMRDHAPRLANHPALSALLADNGKESQTQAIRLRACIGALDGGAAKATPIRRPPALAAVSQALAQVIDTEEASRGMLALYALKHLEIGSYRFLASEAENCREPDIATICRHSLEEELAMAARLELELKLKGLAQDEDAAAAV